MKLKGSVHQGSFVAKVAALGVGQFIIMRDHVPPNSTATRLERDIHTQSRRSPALKDSVFTTKRRQMIDGDRLVPVLEITREQ